MHHCHLRHTVAQRCSTPQGPGFRIGTRLAFVAVLLLGGVCACSSKTRPAADDYSGQAKFAYEEAMEAYESGDHLEALKQFNYVRTKFPYSKFATLATLRVADTYFKQDQYPEAIEAYRRFIQLHPTHPEVPYAQYRVGLSFYEQLPGDWFFMPPAFERDLTSTEDAERELARFLELYPNNQYAEEVGEKLSEVRQRLADHEFFVASFYMKREHPRAAAMRLEALLARFPGIGFDEQSLFLLGKAYLMLSDVAKAVATWGELIGQYPEHPLAIKADEYIASAGLAAAMKKPALPAEETGEVPSPATTPLPASPPKPTAPAPPAPAEEVGGDEPDGDEPSEGDDGDDPGAEPDEGKPDVEEEEGGEEAEPSDE